ncbi:MAG: NAD(P)/FAD-dependent oxidoreductase [Aquificae bacterium]|nr:NAD(P)/FAD-dependent oxidoreductase [Aquificota bacterium]
MLRTSSGARVLVVGGGYGGVTAAKYVKKLNPQAEVVLIERNPFFVSCPMSNLFLVDLIEFSSLCFPYNTLTVKYGVKVLRESVREVDLEKNEVVLSRGRLKYDFLVLSPGIEYDYEENPPLKEAYWAYPPAFKEGGEILYLKKLVEEFEGKRVVFSVPKAPFRCLPAPYERAALFLSYIKERGLRTHLFFVDENPEPPVLTKGFLKAYEDIYRDVATYIPSTRVYEVDLKGKRVVTDKGILDFDVATLIPPMKASDLLERSGLLKKGEKWVRVNPLTFESQVENVFVIGDSAKTYLPKSGYAAHSQGKVVAKVITERIRGRRWEGEVIQQAICYAMVSLKEAIMLEIEYRYDLHGKTFRKIKREDNERKESTVKRYYEWARGLWRDLFT